MNRGVAIGLVAIVVLGALGGGYAYLAHVDAESEAQVVAAAQAREARRAAQREQERARRIEESRELMPPPLRDVQLGMTREALEAAHRDLSPSRNGMLEETLENGAQVMYRIEENQLVEVQVLSMLGEGNIGAHLGSMNEQYGIPSGVWDCRGDDGIETRRFTWRKREVAVSDVFLIYGERVSVTLFVTSVDRTTASLARSHCTPVPADRIATFPRAAPAALEAVQKQAP